MLNKVIHFFPFLSARNVQDKNLHHISSPEEDLQSNPGMAVAILTSLLKRLSSSIQGASNSSSTKLPSSSDQQELQKLERTMKRIHALLDDAEEKDISDKSQQLRLQELKEVAYDAEDAVDEYEYEVLHAKIEARRQALANRIGNKHDEVLLHLNYYHPKVSISDELALRVRDIRERFKEITDDWNRIILRGKVGKRRRTRKWKPMETTTCFDQAKTFGREDEKNRIIKWLLQEESSGNKISVLGIVGMGGLGKSTLAQMSYYDARVQNHFNSTGWIYVSEDFDVPSLMNKICKSFCNIGDTDERKSIDFMSLNELHQRLKVMLVGKKILLVLDDVWNEKIELWSSLKTLLIDAGAGKILVTTRSEHVAQIMQAAPLINLGHLSFDDSWLLFKKIVYEGRDHNFLETGKKIVNKCGGLPLAIKVLAGILRCEDEEEAWLDLLESELWELDKEKDDIFPALKLSYDHLPIELKQCFMYLCLFPKGSELKRSEMVGQWMSHGFIQPKGKKMEEDAGNDYCNEFLRRSLLQYDNRTGLKDNFMMHDLIHDLAQSVAKDEYLLITHLKSHYTVPKTIRHVGMHIQDETDIINLEHLREAKNLRTLILSIRGGIQTMDVFPNLTCLRSLRVRGIPHIKIELPDSIGCLKHLRYLKHEDSKTIPASLYKLHFLQTLEFHHSCKLSRDIGDLINLRHLSGCFEDHVPREVLGLTNLQTVPEIRLGAGSEDNEGWKMKDLKVLSNLRGELEVTGLERVAWPDVTPPEAYLKDKRGIKILRLRWSYDAQEEVEERLAAQVLDSLQPHCDLASMSIHNYPGVVLPTWLGHELPALKRLYIMRTRGVKSFVVPSFEEKKKKKSDGFDFERRSSCSPPAAAAAASSSSTSTENGVGRWFPSLEELMLFEMKELEEWQGAEDPDFLPCLHQLDIRSCPKLRMLPSLSHLHQLIISRCPRLRRLPSLPSLTILSLQHEFSPELLIACCCCLPTLRNLWITDCRTLRSVEGLGGLASLQDLKIEECRDLRSVEELGGLASLQRLEINECRNLRSVEGFGGLASLQRLVINNCPLLQISPGQRLPSNLEDVELKKSPGAEEWYQNQVSGVSDC